mmetsp:Transcript_7264/g.17599  ORF Transcript_7264/g.17599 Transcript_7264/m.17599 type:complete len:680 (-) Transcript_7264:649-2688(-)|eukprot:CAMPEP_0178998040 /NCGR_PEP_ID=MMETSP0795-20121207/9309_1 /TAXON_ID=88552 /ORGANISM="Amoebophrya sp., Strain Ameob2" /LENGTH=679 /DNA_ID=CAMNT_0020690709 /DNA_START=158 /DNA_END=2197 /DNA_ORIENTATION=-
MVTFGNAPLERDRLPGQQQSQTHLLRSRQFLPSKLQGGGRGPNTTSSSSVLSKSNNYYSSGLNGPSQPVNRASPATFASSSLPLGTRRSSLTRPGGGAAAPGSRTTFRRPSSPPTRGNSGSTFRRPSSPTFRRPSSPSTSKLEFYGSIAGGGTTNTHVTSSKSSNVFTRPAGKASFSSSFSTSNTARALRGTGTVREAFSPDAFEIRGMIESEDDALLRNFGERNFGTFADAVSSQPLQHVGSASGSCAFFEPQSAHDVEGPPQTTSGAAAATPFATSSFRSRLFNAFAFLARVLRIGGILVLISMAICAAILLYGGFSSSSSPSLQRSTSSTSPDNSFPGSAISYFYEAATGAVGRAYLKHVVKSATLHRPEEFAAGPQGLNLKPLIPKEDAYSSFMTSSTTSSTDHPALAGSESMWQFEKTIVDHVIVQASGAEKYEGADAARHDEPDAATDARTNTGIGLLLEEGEARRNSLSERAVAVEHHENKTSSTTMTLFNSVQQKVKTTLNVADEDLENVLAWALMTTNQLLNDCNLLFQVWWELVTEVFLALAATVRERGVRAATASEQAWVAIQTHSRALLQKWHEHWAGANFVDGAGGATETMEKLSEIGETVGEFVSRQYAWCTARELDAVLANFSTRLEESMREMLKLGKFYGRKALNATDAALVQLTAVSGGEEL